MNNKAKATSLVALIKKRLDIEASTRPGKTGQFEVRVDGKQIVVRGGNWLTRRLGAGYPSLESVVDQLAKLRTG